VGEGRTSGEYAISDDELNGIREELSSIMSTGDCENAAISGVPINGGDGVTRLSATADLKTCVLLSADTTSPEGIDRKM